MWVSRLTPPDLVACFTAWEPVALNKSQKIEEPSLVDKLVGLIRDAIINGDIEPGSHIRIKKLADDYGVSMIPVREALARLLSSRLIRVENNRGYFVVDRPTASQFAQFVQARELFESSIIAAGFDNVEPGDLKKLRSLNERMRKVAASQRADRTVKWFSLNAEFHQVLVGLARNEYLSDQYADLSLGNMHFQLVRSYPTEFTSLETLVDQHDALIAALEARDKETFFSVFSAHIRNVTIED